MMKTIKELIEGIIELRKTKAPQYETNDILYAFKRGAEILNCSVLECVEAFQAKHAVSIDLMLNNIEEGKHTYTEDYIYEKFTDWFAYEVFAILVLLEGDKIHQAVPDYKYLDILHTLLAIDIEHADFNYFALKFKRMLVQYTEYVPLANMDELLTPIWLMITTYNKIKLKHETK